MTASRPKVLAAHLLLACALTTGAQAKSVTIRITSDGSRIEYAHRGKRLSEQSLEQLCAAAKKQKSEIVFQRDKMSADNALASILGEARCLGAKSSSAAKAERSAAKTERNQAKAGRHSEKPKAAARTHAKHRRTKGTPR